MKNEQLKQLSHYLKAQVREDLRGAGKNLLKNKISTFMATGMLAGFASACGYDPLTKDGDQSNNIPTATSTFIPTAESEEPFTTRTPTLIPTDPRGTEMLAKTATPTMIQVSIPTSTVEPTVPPTIPISTPISTEMPTEIPTQTPTPTLEPTPTKTPESTLPPETEAIPLRTTFPYWVPETAFEEFKKNVEAFRHPDSHVILYSYYLDEQGKIQHYSPARYDKKITAFAHEHNVPVLALISNEVGEWDEKRVVDIISDPARRTQHVADLVALTETIGVDGVNIDYEALKPERREFFTAFIKELSTAMHQKDKKVGVSLHSKFGEGDGRNSKGAGAQDFEELGKAADWFGVMAFGENGYGDQPGPVRSCTRHRLLTEYAAHNIPDGKLFMGNGLYGNTWRAGTTEADAIEFGETEFYRQKQNITPQWAGEELCSHHFKYRNTEDTEHPEHEVYYEDHRSVLEKTKISLEYGAGVMLWQLGNENLEDGLRGPDGKIPGPGGPDPKIWKIFDSKSE